MSSPDGAGILFPERAKGKDTGDSRKLLQINEN